MKQLPSKPPITIKLLIGTFAINATDRSTFAVKKTAYTIERCVANNPCGSGFYLAHRELFISFLKFLFHAKMVQFKTPFHGFSVRIVLHGILHINIFGALFSNIPSLVREYTIAI
jgi:hypothetical protein